MSKIILQPTANKVAYEHYIKTIENPVSIEIIKMYVDEEIFRQLELQYPNGLVRVWGVLNRENDVNKKKWERITRGDIVLFSKKNEVFASAITTLTLQSKALAEGLWGVDEKGNTWENIYFVEEVKNIHISYNTLNILLGYKENYIIRGFNVLSEEQSKKIALKYDLFSKEIYEEITEDDYIQYIVGELDGGTELNIESITHRRREQAFLRQYLFGRKKESICGICGRKLPVSMLITSHIKKRSECSNQEKLDYKNVVMPMCKFGCDDLYEKGFIYVQDGTVKINPHKWITKDLRKELDRLAERKCEYYNDRTKVYFEAHRKKFNI